MIGRLLLPALSNIGRETFRIVLPSSCVSCEGELPWRDRAGSCCGTCWRALPKITRPKCRRCAIAGPEAAGEPGFTCIQCTTRPLALDWIDAWGEYNGSLERLLHAFKFARHDFLAAPLAMLLAETFASRDERFDLVVPVPMHPRKRAARGYNQAALLAERFARLTGHRLAAGLLEKNLERQQQSTLPRNERRANLRDVFVAGRLPRGASVLLLDDICTTGETLHACATTLRRAGAFHVSALVVARTM